MQVLLDDTILVATAVAATVWFLLRFWLEPRQLRRLVLAPVTKRPARSVPATVLSILRSMSATVVFAGLIVVAGTVALRVYLGRLSEDEAGLSALVRLRGIVDEALNSLTVISASAWIASLTGLALLWLLIASGKSRRRWKAALDLRREAADARFAQATPEELRTAALETDAASVAELDNRIAGLVQEKADTVEKARHLPVLSIGESKASLDDLTNIIFALREPASEEEVAEHGKSAANIESDRQTSADALQSQLDQVKREFRIPVQTLDGERTVPFAVAERTDTSLVAPDSSVYQALRNLAVQGELTRQDSLASARPSSEPEFFNQWVGAILTGEQAAQLGGRIGFAARTVLLALLLVGLVGFGAQVQGPIVQQRLAQIEIAIGENLTDQQLAEAMAAAQSQDDTEEENETSTDVELASDAETSAQLTQAMRSGVARALQSGNLGQTRVSLSRRQSFELATIDARQRILVASTRPAPSAAAQALPAVEFRAAIPEHPGAFRGLDEILDDTIERRIERMRSNEALWRRMRAAAARPAPPDLVADQFLRAAFTGDRLRAPLAIRAWTQRATLDVAAAAIRSGTIPHTYTPTTKIDAYVDFISVHDRALIADFEARTPRNVADHIDGVRTGRIDPGSLHRASVTTPIRPTGGSGSAYADLFPAFVEGAADAAGGGGGGGGAEGRVGPKGGGSASARSYSQVRFNRRVGGVVIGRASDPSDLQVEVTAFDWTLTGESLEIFVTSVSSGRRSLGRFHPAIAHHALAYAADGRVVTSTLPQSLPPQNPEVYEIEVPTRQVVVHPAFEDTAFACAAIEIDRFVDRTLYSGDDATVRYVADRDAVSLFGRILELRANYRADDIAATLPDISDYVKSCGTGDNCFPIERYSNSGMNFGGADGVLQCVANSADPAARCVSSVAQLRNTAAYSVDSGVREMRFALTPDLAFLRLDGNTDDPLWPMDFIVQAVPVALADDDVALQEALEPWTFPAWKDGLRQLVGALVKSDPEANNVLQQMRQFTILQRLFRLALEGDLGLSFPLHSLVAMQEATRDFVTPRRHEHWNVNHAQPFPEFVAALQREESGLVSSLRSVARDQDVAPGCRSAALAQIDAYEMARWPHGPSLWPTLSEVPVACSGEASTYEFDRRYEELTRLDLVEEAIAIQRTIGSDTDAGCPPL